MFMITLRELRAYSDNSGNEVFWTGEPQAIGQIRFGGRDNRLVVSNETNFEALDIRFDCDGGLVQLGPNRIGVFSANIRVGQDSSVVIGADVTTTRTCTITAAERTSVTIGDDVMLSSENDIRTDDGHPIFDVSTGIRINPSKSIRVGNHVWLAKRAVLLGGADVGDGSIVGFGSLVAGPIPNNCVAVGSPARVVRKNVAWERPHLTQNKPYLKPNADSIQKSAYWALTVEGTPVRDRATS